MSQMTAIGWVVDDDGPDKRRAGGAAEFAQALAEVGAAPEGHKERCPTCSLLGEELACVGLVEPRISAWSEEWLAGRLPTELESLPGKLLQKNLEESGARGEGGARLRELGLCEAPGPFTRHYGPFFRRYTVTTDQLLEELFLAGDVQPAHALGVLVHLGGVAIDGNLPLQDADGIKLSEVFQDVASRRERVLCTIDHDEDDDPSQRELKRYLRALYAAFVLDTEVRVYAPAL